QDGAQAVIERKADPERGDLYRYIPAENISGTSDGTISFEGTDGDDPCGYLDAGASPAFLKEYHTEWEWLEWGKYQRYPDAVVGIANQMFWDGQMAARENRYSPDMVLCANAGWSFEKAQNPAGGHGYLYYESTHIPLLVTGPNVRKGIMISDAVRTADIVPTVLSLLGINSGGKQLDGMPIKGFLKREGEPDMPSGGGSANALLARLPREEAVTDSADIISLYERRRGEKKPAFLATDERYQGHNLESPGDIHVISANVLGLLNREVFDDVDNLFDLAYPGDRKKPLSSGIGALGAGYDKIPNIYPKERVGELMHALQIKELTWGDAPSIILMSPTGAAGRGAIFRGTLIITWLEHIFSDMDYAMLYPVRDRNIRVVSNVNYLLEGVRISLEKISWGLTHYVGKALYDGIYHVEKFDEKIVRGEKGQ
ncbi:MAG: hypothetical protein NT045_05320, partial [Candidatus Aureabacteria bacterium]|nr:hypothetical protein [Candidatus Auribacterota bacterium]